ncbi:MAG TPA: EAL domain-containing protein [Verrucomicrobiae bacterium]|nr:EAL domain-containing protein [Verrucomicrobiae bacterium]
MDVTSDALLAPRLFADLLDASVYHFDPMSLGHFAAALIVATCGALVLFWERGSRVSRLFAGFAVLFTFWAAGRGLIRLMTDPELVFTFGRPLYVLIMLCMPMLYQLAMVMLRVDGLRAGFIRLHWLIGFAVAGLTVGTNQIIGGVHVYSWGIEPAFAPLGFATMIWVGAMMVMAALDGVRAWRNATPGTRERRRVAAVTLALGVLYLAFVDFLAGMGFSFYPLAFIPVAVFTMIMAWLTLHYGLVEVTPQLAAQEIASLVRGALLILDRDGIIQFANPDAERLLGRERLVGMAGRTVMGDSLDPDSLTLLARAEGREAEKELLHQPGGKNGPVKDLVLSASAVRDRRERDVAFVCLIRDVTDQKRVAQQRQAEGLRDSVTGLPSRPMFLELLDGAVKRASEANDYDFAVCFIGMDRLNVVNEDLGYSAGDQVLAEVALRLRRASRAQDVVARIGGDEFGILLESAGPEDVQRFVQRVTESIRAPLQLADHNLHLSASIGVAESTWSYANGAEVLRDAGMAMYRVKQTGGGDVHIVTRSDRGLQRTRLESDMHRALQNGEFRVYYQPVMDLVERRVVGFEALVRWQHPERGLLLPGAFIELAEQIGIARQIDYFVMDRAMADLARFQQLTGDRRISMSFNMAEGGLRDPQFTEQVGATLARHGLEPASIRVELLERVAMIQPLRNTLARLRGLGVGLAIDDFGTGYSSLNRLHELPLTVLKIDREFVRAMTGGHGGEKVINAIIALAQSLGLMVIAEGASQVREVRRLLDFGCRYVQGFYFSQAVPFEAALALLRQPAQMFGDRFRDVTAAWLAPVAQAADVRQAQGNAGNRQRIGSRLGKWFGLH